MDVKLPKLGEGADSGTVVSVLVKEGDRIRVGQTIVELENEKAVAAVPSTASGVVTQVRVKEGDRLGVGQLILTVAEEPAAPAGTAAPARAAAPRKELLADTAESRILAEEPGEQAPAEAVAPPSIRRLARELGLDLGRIRGSERGGRITMEDVRGFIQQLQQLAFGKSRAAGVAPAPAGPAAPVVPKVEPIDFSQWGPVTRKPLSNLRQTISRRLTDSWNTIPHVTQFEEIDITELNALRQQWAPAYEGQGVKLTLTPLVMRAVAAVLARHPMFNASLDESGRELVLKNYYHLGVAVDTDQGLLVPVVREVDKKSVLQLARELNEAADRARQRKLSLEEMRGGTFTISNQGGIGGSFFTPIVNKPEVAILGLGRSVLKPVVRDGQVAVRLLMPVGLSYDHRLIDGAMAARFIVDLGQALQGVVEAQLKL